MDLRAITVENYRCFHEQFRLELRPLTLLYGWNNAGKSTAARLIDVLGMSIEGRARVPLENRAGLGYRDLVWRPAEQKPGALRFGLEWQDPAKQRPNEEALWRLDLQRDNDRMYVRELELSGGSWNLHLRAAQDEGPNKYFRENGQLIPISFHGLIPSSAEASLGELRSRLSALSECCSWIRGDRALPRSLIPIDTPPPRKLDDDGAGAAELLVSPGSDALLAAVARWYARPEINRELRVTEVQGHRQLLLNPLDARFDVPLVDTGAGMGQVLPVLTAIAWAKELATHDNQKLLAVEEPESQLHPNAQRAFGEWICEQASADPSPLLVLETHSRVLILAIQLAIARGTLDPERVAIYWLEQRENGSTYAAQIELDSFGRPDSQWPSDVFADELELSELLTEKQIERGAWD